MTTSTPTSTATLFHYAYLPSYQDAVKLLGQLEYTDDNVNGTTIRKDNNETIVHPQDDLVYTDAPYKVNPNDPNDDRVYAITPATHVVRRPPIIIPPHVRTSPIATAALEAFVNTGSTSNLLPCYDSLFGKRITNPIVRINGVELARPVFYNVNNTWQHPSNKLHDLALPVTYGLLHNETKHLIDYSKVDSADVDLCAQVEAVIAEWLVANPRGNVRPKYS